ncbi:hypothetical protein A3C96_00440 [Candidatus Uhrbacteria bacterium RIFCSPHIGHO2_02_FULL_60_10]|uniref:PDZ domain-containing protein n=1 Tax=Candidatus Uhrbacteria bacterium RIFCSPHIGHO2_02_FULL_60_10 TaxID=1802392 RepID=A0A1F7U4N8_9BACT|nr:MAG: hypothetical protein A3C96_00440 [Candidatus Uhrbacteria bacterium RIFCSPHIGHO2_02_FULL_60_10]
MLYSILVFVLVLSVLVLVHELGHFLTARKVGIAVEEFGFGFPPRAWGIKRGRTLYSLNWIPLGGFVRIKGELGEHAGDRDSYASKSRWQKAAVLVAGVVMNFLLAWALLTVGYLAGLPQVVDETPVGARVASPQIIIASVLPKTPAAESGLEAGDVIRSVGERPVSEIEAFREYTASHADQAVLLTVERGGDLKQIAVVPVLLTETGRPGIGVSLMKTGLVSYPWYWAPVQGAAATWSFLGHPVGVRQPAARPNLAPTGLRGPLRSGRHRGRHFGGGQTRVAPRPAVHGPAFGQPRHRQRPPVSGSGRRSPDVPAL